MQRRIAQKRAGVRACHDGIPVLLAFHIKTGMEALRRFVGIPHADIRGKPALSAKANLSAGMRAFVSNAPPARERARRCPCDGGVHRDALARHAGELLFHQLLHGDAVGWVCQPT